MKVCKLLDFSTCINFSPKILEWTVETKFKLFNKTMIQNILFWSIARQIGRLKSEEIERLVSSISWICLVFFSFSSLNSWEAVMMRNWLPGSNDSVNPIIFDYRKYHSTTSHVQVNKIAYSVRRKNTFHEGNLELRKEHVYLLKIIWKQNFSITSMCEVFHERRVGLRAAFCMFEWF